MKRLAWWKKTELDADLQHLETGLLKSLMPISPRPEFIAGLRQNLLVQIPGEVEQAVSVQKQKLQTGLLVAGGIFGGILLLISGIRGMVSLAGALGLLINWLRQNGQPASSTANSSK